jgi:hypothetical protein
VVLLSNIEFERYWFGVLPLHIGYLFETGYYKEPESSPTGASLGIYEERKICKWRWQRRLQSGLGEFAPFGRKVKTFYWGEEDWLEEGLLVPAKKKIKEKDYSRRFSHGPRRKCATKIMCNHLEEFQRRRVTTMVYQCKHGGMVQPYPHQFLRCPT